MKYTLNLKRIDMGDEGCHMFCKGKVQGKKVRVLIDTGASKSVITQELADTFDNLPEVEVDDNETSGIGPEKVVAQFVRLKKISLNDLRIKDLVVGVVNLEHVVDLYHKLGYKPFDLILGGDILQKYKAVIDYKQRTLTLRK